MPPAAGASMMALAPAAPAPAASCGRQDGGDEEAVCYFCLQGGELVRPCRCPNGVHLDCLGRWQLAQAGKREECFCRFCSSALPPWTSTLLPQNVKPSTPTLALKFQGRTCKILKIQPGPEGLAELKAQVREVLGIELSDDFDVQFECKVPSTGETIKLSGLASYPAAIQCASIAASTRRANRRASAMAAAAGQGQGEGQGQVAYPPHATAAAVPAGQGVAPKEESAAEAAVTSGSPKEPLESPVIAVIPLPVAAQAVAALAPPAPVLVPAPRRADQQGMQQGVRASRAAAQALSGVLGVASPSAASAHGCSPVGAVATSAFSAPDCMPLPRLSDEFGGGSRMDLSPRSRSLLALLPQRPSLSATDAHFGFAAGSPAGPMPRGRTSNNGRGYWGAGRVSGSGACPPPPLPAPAGQYRAAPAALVAARSDDVIRELTPSGELLRRRQGGGQQGAAVAAPVQPGHAALAAAVPAMAQPAEESLHGMQGCLGGTRQHQHAAAESPAAPDAAEGAGAAAPSAKLPSLLQAAKQALRELLPWRRSAAQQPRNQRA